MEESCSPYTGNDTACSTHTCLRLVELSWSNLLIRQALHCKLWLRRWLLWGMLRGGHERGTSQFGVMFFCFSSPLSFASWFSFLIQALVSGGPLSVSFMVFDDFSMYKSGVYHHISLLSGPFQPLEVKRVKPRKFQIHVPSS